jgi:hypothetical protein
MSVKLKDLLTPYAAAMHEGDAALFIGAGMSRPAGFVDWKGLLAKCALEIGLDVDREHDLVEVAQFYLNSRPDRSSLNQALIDEFAKRSATTVYHRIVARLPVSTIWTTNFDVLIEQALRREQKRVDVKLRDGDLAWRIPGRAAVLYKMHGDVGHPQEVVICKDDYEGYPRTHPIFQNALEGDLLNKTFLFLGFSFKDPNLGQMLGHVRPVMQESKRKHYNVMRRVRLNWDKESTVAHQEYEYEKVKQQHEIENLKRYSIYTHLVDRYRDMRKVLRCLAHEYRQRIIYLWVRESDWNQTVDSAKLARMLGARLLPAMEQDALRAREFTNVSRKAMIKESGFVIFLGGSESDGSEIARDFVFAERVGTVSIPVGISGSAARTIWERIRPNLERVYGKTVSADTFDKLNVNCLETVVEAVVEIIRNVSSRELELAPKRQLSQSDRRLVYEDLREYSKNKKELSILTDKDVRRIVGDL